jgi:hypothetical protein
VQGIRYNSGREKNKQQDFYERHNDNGGNGFFKHAVPVDITIVMSIMSKYQQDMDQILSNFMTSANPYIVLIWKLPKTLGFSEDYIIEIPVSWDGNVNIVQPVEL